MFRKIRIFLEMIKIEHTLFALPFAFMGAILGSMVVNDTFPSWMQIMWVLLAMVGARSAAFGLNRIIDQAIDGKNPRTAMRAIPAGLLKNGEVVIFVIISFVLLFWASSNLNVLSMQLLPIAVFMLVLYSYTKRFTWLCHVVLGMTIGWPLLVAGWLSRGQWIGQRLCCTLRLCSGQRALILSMRVGSGIRPGRRPSFHTFPVWSGPIIADREVLPCDYCHWFSCSVVDNRSELVVWCRYVGHVWYSFLSALYCIAQ